MFTGVLILLSEAEWLACEDPRQMLQSPPCRKASERKLRLFACACCRRLLRLYHRHRETIQSHLESAEAFADGRAVDLLQALAFVQKMTVSCGSAEEHARKALAWLLRRYESPWNPLFEIAEESALGRSKYDGCPLGTEQERQAGLLRDVIGNPFRLPVLDRSWLSKEAGTVRKLTRSIDREGGQAFDRLPILADALEDAGCTDAAILDHCRSPGPHVRGCWVIDLLLGKE